MSAELEPETVLGVYLAQDRQHGRVDNKFTQNVVQQVLKHMNRLFEVLLQQTCLDGRDAEASYSIYGVNARSREARLEHKLEIEFSSRNGKHDGVLQAENDGSGQLTLSMMSPFTMHRWLQANETRAEKCGRQPVALPIFFSAMDSKEAGHMTVLFFDVASRIVYLVDPNGRSSFFDSALQVIGADGAELCSHPPEYASRSQYLVDTALRGYVESLNQVSKAPWFFVSQIEWNPDGQAVNRNIAISHIGNGHCVVTSLAIAHYAALCGQTPSSAVARFAALPDARLISLITSYNAYLDGLFALFNEPLYMPQFDIPNYRPLQLGPGEFNMDDAPPRPLPALPIKWREDALADDEFDASMFT
jgi:hypothetical protein